jgi:hypothetical protein
VATDQSPGAYPVVHVHSLLERHVSFTSPWFRIATFGQNKPHRNDWLKIKTNVLDSKSNFFELASASSQGFGEG